MLGSPAGPGAASHQRGLWPLAPAPAPSANTFSSDGLSRYGVYSLFPGGPGFGGALYSHSSAIGRFASGPIPPSSAASFHTSHKESLFSSAGYTFGAPTPPPGSPYSPVTSGQLELFAKGYNSNIVIQQPPDYPLSPKKGQVLEKSRCEDICLKIKPEKSTCGCLISPSSKKYLAENSSGCSRTNPIEWSPVNVKKEPNSTPCQVAEVTTSASPIVKVEITSPIQKCPDVHGVALPSAVVTSNGNIPVGIAVARQRLHYQETASSPSLPPAGLLTTVNTTTQIKEISRIHQEVDSTAGMAASTTGGVPAGGTLLQCTDDRATGLAGWSMGGPSNSTLAAPTLWQYPATLPVEPVLPLPALPVPPVGVQLVRDPSSGHLLLLPATTGIEQVQQAVVWPSYPQPSSVLLPPMPPPPLQLLSSASSDFLSSSTTLHQHTQTHSTRLLAVTTTDAKRKIPLPIPTTTLIKIEADAASTLDQAKTLQAVSTIASNTGTVFTEQNMAPLVTTHVIYQHPTNLILSQTPSNETACRSQATSPVACLTPPPETNTVLDEEVPGVQDASNQTDTPFCSEDDNTTHALCDVVGEAKGKQLDEQQEYRDEKVILASSPQEVTSSTTPIEETMPRSKFFEVCDDYNQDKLMEIVQSSTEVEIPEPSSSTNDVLPPENLEDTPPKTPEPVSSVKPDISGLELLSNSIFEFENSRKTVDKIIIKREKEGTPLDAPNVTQTEAGKEARINKQVDDNLGGLDLLCALAEQRILEEVEGQKKKEIFDSRSKDASYWERHERKKEKRKAKKHSEESRHKKIKVGNEYYKYKEKSHRSKHESDIERLHRRNSERIYKSDSERIRKKEERSHRRDSDRFHKSDTEQISKRDANRTRSSDDERVAKRICVPYERIANGFENCYELTNRVKCNGVSETESCNCKDHRAYKSRKSEEEVRKFIASKSQPAFVKDDWPTMNAMELDMRLKLAELQRQYKEKQRELSKLKPKKKSYEEKSSKKKKLKKKSHSDRSITPPPQLDKMDVPVKPNKNTSDLLKPPTLCAIEPPEHLRIKSNPQKQMDTLKVEYRLEPNKRIYSPDLSDSTPEKLPSSKKRKVGRPKKLMTSPGLSIATETIVAKKPKKGTFVGYLLAAKEKLQMQNKSGLIYSSSPPRYVEEPLKKSKSHKHKLNNNNSVCNGSDEQTEKSCKIRPKLKAEPTVKEHVEEEEENDDNDEEWEEEVQEEESEKVEEPEEIEEPKEETPISSENVAVAPKEELVVEPEELHTVEVEEKEDKVTQLCEETESDIKVTDNRCILTTEHLKVDKLRVLTVMGGLFYAGHLNAIEPPDVYSITLDGERGNRPHIMSREEILRDAIVEIAPTSTDELPVGTRLCAYWSQQYRCLYPGSVAEPGTPDPVLDSKFVAVEFDDGDSGRIAIEDIRLLPPDYPIMEYDPNPLLSLSKRRRRTSINSTSTEERRSGQYLSTPLPSTSSKVKQNEQEKENKDTNKPDSSSSHKERKRLKKRKKDKLKQKLSHEDKKKKKKHKCSDDHCKHKKHHKKRRKHKKHHHKECGEEKSLKVSSEKGEEDEEEEEEDNVVQIPPVTEEIEEEEGEGAPEEEQDSSEDQRSEEQSSEEQPPEEHSPEAQSSEEQPSEEQEELDTSNEEYPVHEVTMDDIDQPKRKSKSKKIRDRQESCESRSKMTAFLPARQLWSWSGRGYTRNKGRGRSRKRFYRTIQRGKETIAVGDAAVFLSTGRPDRPFIGKIESLWEKCGTMIVKVQWFYHPEETKNRPSLEYPGALFESPHCDENDVQTISHKCEVLSLKDYRERLGDDPKQYATIYDNNDLYYLAGYYDPSETTLTMQPGIPFKTTD